MLSLKKLISGQTPPPPPRKKKKTIHWENKNWKKKINLDSRGMRLYFQSLTNESWTKWTVLIVVWFLLLFRIPENQHILSIVANACRGEDYLVQAKMISSGSLCTPFSVIYRIWWCGSGCWSNQALPKQVSEFSVSYDLKDLNVGQNTVGYENDLWKTRSVGFVISEICQFIF